MSAFRGAMMGVSGPKTVSGTPQGGRERDGVLAPTNGAGSSGGFLAQILPHIPAATRYAAKKISPGDVDDVIQESLMRIVNSGADEDVRHPKSYFFTVVKATIIDRLRYETVRHRKDHCELIDTYHPVDDICPCRALVAKQSLQRVMARMAAMPARTRAMIVAIRLEGKTFKEVAEHHGVSLSTVEKEIARALAHLAQEMDPD